MSLEWAVLFGQTVAMVVAALLLVYPLVRYSPNVAYTEGMVALAIGFLALAAGWAVVLFTDAILLYRTIVAVAALFGLVGAAYFALPFIHTDDAYDGGPEFVTGGEPEGVTGDGPPAGGGNESDGGFESPEPTANEDDGGFGDAVRE